MTGGSLELIKIQFIRKFIKNYHHCKMLGND